MEETLVPLVDVSGPLGADCLWVEWRGALVPLAGDAARRVKERWGIYVEEAKREGRLLFNGAVTCLIGARQEEREGRPGVVLTLGAGDYQRFLVTCLRDRAWFERRAPEAMAAALGNSVLLTHGDRALLGIRSENVSAYPGRAHLIGGVAEPLGSDRFPAGARGLLAHLELELHEEAGLGRDDLATGGPMVMGLARDAFLNQPELFWRWETTVELERVAERLDPAEHAGAVLIQRQNVVQGLPGNLTPVARHAVNLWAGQR